MKRQAKIIQEMSDREILLNLYITQAIMLLIAVVLGFFLIDDMSAFWEMFKWNPVQIFLIGGGIAIIVIIIDLLFDRFLPKVWMDDGGINERVFAKRNVFHIFFIALIVSISEEILFRGILQTQIGLILASLLFALIHFRYLSKPLLFSMAVILSFVLGLLFELTNNLLVPIFTHFLIDFVLGLYIMISARKKT
ncbi:CPBP family intramembrane glutamic endopeptidase [Alkalihalobacterium chitinilyticum]|uniref:CPBP family intramembrane metalloprotease n=1 Tax=Alkalihalobacterium chitinilyticum TaxID=2980103 RepID=A0ABT5VA43_9BACI|nr:CPBP family intramembrane glutamic endopeptidase [Alkalihalobacterium chitinilyticum]MDE5411976.1 CPBP family intramembrane metalloprotease [Alkalihalobacterium chitinilyticum]